MFVKIIKVFLILLAPLLYGKVQTQQPQCVCLSVQKGQQFVMNAQPIEQQNIGDTCFANIDLQCDSQSKYRYLDGRCNNAIHQSWGMSNKTIVRLLPPVYSQNSQDPPESIRVSVSDNNPPLQSPRVISNIFFTDKPFPDKQYSLAFMLLGQLFVHDTLSLKLRSPPTGACCNITQRVRKEKWDRGCLSIDIPSKDAFYSQFGVICSQFTRAQTSDDFGCNLLEIEQGNSVTTLFDGSVIYGASDEISSQLRLFQQGKLKFETTDDGRVFLPHQDKANTLCFVETNKGSCFLGSDFRANQHAQLSLLQVILLRVHNKLCDELIQINANNPNWKTDEIIFQETKRLLTAILQNIFFGRYAEVLFGPDCSAAYGLTSGGSPENSYESGYDAELNPGTLAEFQHVVSRIFHTLIEGDLKLMNENRNEVGSFRLSDWFFKPTLIKEPGIFDQMIIGLTAQPMQNFDRFFTKTITDELLKQLNNNKFGTDLASIDIMRGRDCGIPPYLKFATLAGFPEVTSFADLTAQIDPKMVERLQKVYENVWDIDAYLGCALEKRFGDSMVGKTIHTIYAEQMRRYKFGDSHFFTFDGPGKFKLEQLKAIQSVTLSFLLCYGSDQLQQIQRDAFVLPELEKLVPCEIIIEEFLQQFRIHWVED